MKLKYFIFLQGLLIVIIGVIVHMHKDKVNVTKTPPSSLSKWYKPENKRQEWLHNMFNLRREMQAVKLYSTGNEPELLDKWAEQFNQHYLKISEMVPEWDKKLDNKALTRLRASVKDRNKKGISLALDDLTSSCDSCHQDYRSTVATLYRAPDFSSIKLNHTDSYKKHMKTLIEQVNQVKIASVDGKRDVALSTLSELKHGIKLQGETCIQCHKKDTREYPDAEMNKSIASLETSLATGTLKEQGRALGTLAVQACATCHATHRIAYDNRKQLVDGPDWKALIKH